MPAHMEHADVCCRSCRVGHLHHLHLAVPGQEVPALHQRHRMGIHLGDVAPVILWQAHDAVADAQLMFAYDSGSALPEQLVVVQQTACYGVLDGHQGNHIILVVKMCKHLLEGVAAEQFYILALEIPVGGNIMKTALDALYSYFSHSISLHEPYKRKSRFITERDF